MTDFSRHPLDFERWSRLALEDPAGFEQQRSEMIERQIAAASGRCQRRLRGLQWRIDQVRARSPNPLAACITLSNMMWDAFAGEGGLAQRLNQQGAACSEESSMADIIPFCLDREE